MAETADSAALVVDIVVMSFDFEEFLVEFVRFMSCELLLRPQPTGPGDNEWCSSSAGSCNSPAPRKGLLAVQVR